MKKQLILVCILLCAVLVSFLSITQQPSLLSEKLYLNTQPDAPVSFAGLCGNGILDSQEQCDDGNDAGGDGCSATCLFEQTSTGSFQKVTLASGLGKPTSMAFAPDGRIFYTDKKGRLRIFENGNLLSEPFAVISVQGSGEQGLLGVALHPSFEQNGYVYVYYSIPGNPLHRVSRFTADPSNPNVALPGSEVIILDNIGTSRDATNHNGGAIHFGLDEKLYVAVGDGGSFPGDAQDRSNLNGKLLRINDDGSIPSDNPFVGQSGREEIWAYGLRNPFTFAIDSVSGKIHINDVGQKSWEEISEGFAGANYGWPTCEGPENTGRGTCDDPNFTYPVYAYDHDIGRAITGGTFYRGSLYPSEYLGDYFFTDYTRSWIKRLDQDGTVTDFWVSADSPIDIKVGPDGALYYLSYNEGTLNKIDFLVDNTAPVAVAQANVASGSAPLVVQFNADQSNDPDSDTLSYSWDFGDGTTTSGVSVEHTFTAAGSYTVVLTVQDTKGANTKDTVQIAVGSPPVATILSPEHHTTFAGGTTIAFYGTATDQEDGTLPDTAFEWTVDLLHHPEGDPGHHAHPHFSQTGVRSGSVLLSEAGHPESDTWYRITLTVTDASGLQTTTSVDILPRIVTLAIDTQPSGLQLLLDGQPRSTPYTEQSIEGVIREITALDQEDGGVSYVFDRWSNGVSDAALLVPTPAIDTDYVAMFTHDTQPEVFPDDPSNQMTRSPSLVSQGNSLRIEVSDTVVYRQGYYSLSGQSWQPFTLDGSTLTNDWLWQSGTVDLAIPAQSPASSANWVVAYSCSLVGDQWDCHNNAWQIERFSISS